MLSVSLNASSLRGVNKSITFPPSDLKISRCVCDVNQAPPRNSAYAIHSTPSLLIKLIMRVIRRTHLFVTLFAVLSFLAASLAWIPPTALSSRRIIETSTRKVSQQMTRNPANGSEHFETPFHHFQVEKVAMAFVWSWALLCGSPALAADIAKGQTIFNNNCAACHAGGQNLINAPRTLQREAIEKNLGSLDPETVTNFVQNSVVHRGAFILGSKLSNKDFENVVSYVVDQASNDKWLTE